MVSCLEIKKSRAARRATIVLRAHCNTQSGQYILPPFIRTKAFKITLPQGPVQRLPIWLCKMHASSMSGCWLPHGFEFFDEESLEFGRRLKCPIIKLLCLKERTTISFTVPKNQGLSILALYRLCA
jgi:hypothetical protein